MKECGRSKQFLILGVLFIITGVMFGCTLFWCLRATPVASSGSLLSESQSQDLSEESSEEISEASEESIPDSNIGGTSLPEEPSSNANTDGLDPNKKIIALSFDDGSSKYTYRIVDRLVEYQSKATFFVVGYRLENSADEMLYAYNHGMEIGNHSYNHKDLKGMNQEATDNQIVVTSSLIEKWTGKSPTLYRPPYGSVNQAVLDKVAMPAILWNIDPEDWKYKNAKKTAAHVLEHAKDGDIILLHDVYETTADAVDIFLPELVKRGYQVTNVSQMFAVRGISLEPHKKYFSLSNGAY